MATALYSESLCDLGRHALQEFETYAVNSWLLRQLIDLIDAYVIVKDLNNNIIFCNKYAARYAGVAPEEMWGKHYTTYWPKESQYNWQNDLDVIITGQHKHTIEAVEVADGIVRRLKTSKYPLLDNNGTIRGLLLISIDVEDHVCHHKPCDILPCTVSVKEDHVT